MHFGRADRPVVGAAAVAWSIISHERHLRTSVGTGDLGAGAAILVDVVAERAGAWTVEGVGRIGAAHLGACVPDRGGGAPQHRS